MVWCACTEELLASYSIVNFCSASMRQQHKTEVFKKEEDDVVGKAI